jgi:hypothetical protein
MNDDMCANMYMILNIITTREGLFISIISAIIYTGSVGPRLDLMYCISKTSFNSVLKKFVDDKFDITAVVHLVTVSLIHGLAPVLYFRELHAIYVFEHPFWQLSMSRECFRFKI